MCNGDRFAARGTASYLLRVVLGRLGVAVRGYMVGEDDESRGRKGEVIARDEVGKGWV